MIIKTSLCERKAKAIPPRPKAGLDEGVRIGDEAAVFSKSGRNTRPEPELLSAKEKALIQEDRAFLVFRIRSAKSPKQWESVASRVRRSRTPSQRIHEHDGNREFWDYVEQVANRVRENLERFTGTRTDQEPSSRNGCYLEDEAEHRGEDIARSA
jgi:hypothetical protein